MRGVNKVILLGAVGQDPEVRYMTNGNAACNFSMATSDKWKDKEGVWQESTEWHRVVSFGKLAEIIGQYVKKGSKLYIEGKIQTRKWTDKNGHDKYTTEVVASQMQFLDSKSGSEASGGSGGGNPPPDRSTGADDFDGGPAGSSSNFDDDIPF